MTVPQKYKINFLLCKRSLHFYLWTHKRRFPLELALLLLCILQCLFSCTLRWCALFNISALTLSWRRLFSYRNQPNDLQSKSMDWFYKITASVLKELSVLERYILSIILANDSSYNSKSPWQPAGWINVTFLKTIAFHENDLRRAITVSTICPRKLFRNLPF